VQRGIEECLSIKLHGITSQKTPIWILAAGRTSNHKLFGHIQDKVHSEFMKYISSGASFSCLKNKNIINKDCCLFDINFHFTMRDFQQMKSGTRIHKDPRNIRHRFENIFEPYSHITSLDCQALYDILSPCLWELDLCL
jgi:hypothetical protein